MQAGAQRARPAWSSLPAILRASVVDCIGGTYVDDVAAQGGFSAGYAGVVSTTKGRAFVKAAGPASHAVSLTLYRREGALLPSIPRSLAPRALAVIDGDDGFALVTDVVDGAHPGAAWSAADLRSVARTLSRLAETPAPGGVPDARDDMADFTRWHRIADDAALRDALPHDLAAQMPRLVDMERGFADAVTGRMLIHGDLRADNILIGDGDARFVDWPWAVRGVPWFDLPSLLPSVEAGGGPPCEQAWPIFQEFGAPDPHEHLPIIAGISSYFWYWQGQPEPAQVPGLRAFQRAQAFAALRWLSALL
ncbi:aminoglycoside phosphotransferase family protein [Microbacterium esteraromaticum]|nr:aminoglycoside phosphotransferase family protein [Microbacterium esteraromaticum]